MIKDSGERTEFNTGAVRDMQQADKGRYDLLPWDAIHELAIHCAEGAKKYGERNVEKGIPMHSLIDSAIRHLSCYLRGETDEPHLRAAMWNIAFAIWTERNKPEMQDIPSRVQVEKSEPGEEPRELARCGTCKHHERYGKGKLFMTCKLRNSDVVYGGTCGMWETKADGQESV